jgi:hypothetical protein
MSIVDVASALAVGVAQTVLKPVRPEPGPATARWGVGVGEFAAGRMPGVVRGLARELNRFGSVIVSPAVIEFDGHEVPWSQVTEIKTRRLVGYLLTDAITQGVDRLPIWRFPGRGLVLSGLSHTALTAVAVAADLRLDRGVFTLYLPAEVQSKGLIRRKQMSPGFPAALVLAKPAVRDLIESTAQAHGVPVRQADDDALELAAERAAVIRHGFGQLRALVGIGQR